MTVAIALFFRRIVGPDTPDQDTRVTYDYGPDPGHTSNRLTIDLVADSATATGATSSEPVMWKVVGKIMRLRRETGRWPAEGNYFA